MTDSNTTKSVRDRFDRRTFIGVLAAASVPSLAGCFGDPDQTPEGDDEGEIGEDDEAEAPDDDPEEDEGEAPGQDDDGAEDRRLVEDDPDYEGWFDDVPHYEGTQDFRDEEEAFVDVGAGDDGFLFDPPAIMVDLGTTVEWVWTGEGGSHNVVHEDGEFESELVDEAAHSYAHTFEEPGMYRYVCEPHEAQGMRGAVVVDGENGDEEENGDEQEENGDAPADDE